MINTLLGKIIGTQNERELKRLRPLVATINTLEAPLTSLSDSELRAKTETFKARLAQGESLDDLLPRPLRWYARAGGAYSTCGTSMCSSSAAWCCTAAGSPK